MPFQAPGKKKRRKTASQMILGNQAPGFNPNGAAYRALTGTGSGSGGGTSTGSGAGYGARRNTFGEPMRRPGFDTGQYLNSPSGGLGEPTAAERALSLSSQNTLPPSAARQILGGYTSGAEHFNDPHFVRTDTPGAAGFRYHPMLPGTVGLPPVEAPPPPPTFDEGRQRQEKLLRDYFGLPSPSGPNGAQMAQNNFENTASNRSRALHQNQHLLDGLGGRTEILNEGIANSAPVDMWRKRLDYYVRQGDQRGVDQARRELAKLGVDVPQSAREAVLAGGTNRQRRQAVYNQRQASRREGRLKTARDEILGAAVQQDPGSALRALLGADAARQQYAGLGEQRRAEAGLSAARAAVLRDPNTMRNSLIESLTAAGASPEEVIRGINQLQGGSAAATPSIPSDTTQRPPDIFYDGDSLVPERDARQRWFQRFGGGPESMAAYQQWVQRIKEQQPSFGRDWLGFFSESIQSTNPSGYTGPRYR